MRKFTIIFFVLLLLIVPFFASAQLEVVYPSIPGVFSPQEIAREARTEAEIFPLFMAYLFRLLLVVSLVVVTGVVLYAGLLYLLSTGNPLKTKIAREWILSAIQGALVIFSSYAILFALDSQLLLFQIRDAEKASRIEAVDLDWEIRNTYFQIPFGLLIEDAILNNNAKNKLYDVLDATNQAEAVAEAIYQSAGQLLAIIESCPVGMECGGGAGFSTPPPIPPSLPDPDPGRDETDTNIPTEEVAQKEAEEDGTILGPSTYIDEEGNEWIYDPQDGNIYLYDPTDGTLEPTTPPEGHPWHETEASYNAEQKIAIFRETSEQKNSFSLLNSKNDKGEIDLSFLLRTSSSLLNLLPSSLIEKYAFSVENIKENFDLSSLFSFLSFFTGRIDVGAAEESLDWAEDIAEKYLKDTGKTSKELGEGMRNIPSHWHARPVDDPVDDDTEIVDISDDYVDESLGQANGETEEETPEDPSEEEEGGEEDPTEDPVEDEETEEETPQEDLCCPPCPNIAPAVRSKIAEIESYFPRLLSSLDRMLETKEPLKEDLYQLYKAVMIKSLGSRNIIGYNSLSLARRYYERDEIVIKTDDTKTNIGPYSWDWSQWLYNILYRVRVGGQIIEENDPVTFYIKEPEASKIVRDATSLAMAAREDGIQSAGDRIGIPRNLPPAPPDIGSTLYPPTHPDTTRITSPYGWRYDPFTGDRVMHRGVDFAGPQNTPIYASETGEVIFAGWSGTETTGYGVLLVLYHRASQNSKLDHDTVTYYAHLNADSLQVAPGDTVLRGQHIAGMGTTGRSTGYHLHYEVRKDVSYPFVMHTGDQINPADFINIDLWSFEDLEEKRYSLLKDPSSFVLKSLLSSFRACDVSAQTDLDALNEYLNEHGLNPLDLSEEDFSEILEELGIDPNIFSVFNIQDVDIKSPSDYLTCGMEIPVGETFELSWHHLVELLDTIDYYVSEGLRLIEQQTLMNNLARSCSCPCVGDCCDCVCTDSEGNSYPCPVCGGCQLSSCDLGAIRAAYAEVGKTRAVMRQIAAHIRLLTHGHFNTPTEDICDPLNEDIRDEEEKLLCNRGGSKLITKHELITRKLNYSRYRLDECIARPEHLEDVLAGKRAGHITFFGPLVEEQRLPRYTKTREDGFMVNTSDLNWFCCSDLRLDD